MSCSSTLDVKFTNVSCADVIARELDVPLTARAKGTSDSPNAQATLTRFRNVFFKINPNEGSLNIAMHTANTNASLNDIQTMSASLKNEYEQKYALLSREYNSSDRLKNRLRQEYKILDYNINASQFYTAFGKYALILVCVLFILGGLVLQGKLTTIACFKVSIGVIVLFTILFLLNVFTNMQRQKTNWNKFEWGTVEVDSLNSSRY
jgi:hypothetical protein